MCMICVDLERDKLTIREAWSNFKEMKTCLERDHKLEVKQKIMDKMVEERKVRRGEK